MQGGKREDGGEKEEGRWERVAVNPYNPTVIPPSNATPRVKQKPQIFSDSKINL